MRQEDLSKTGYLISYDSLEKELEKYEAFSKSTWTDLLLQIIKVRKSMADVNFDKCNGIN